MLLKSLDLLNKLAGSYLDTADCNFTVNCFHYEELLELSTNTMLAVKKCSISKT